MLKLKLKLQYFGHQIGKDPDARKDRGQEEKGTCTSVNQLYLNLKEEKKERREETKPKTLCIKNSCQKSL